MCVLVFGATCAPSLAQYVNNCKAAQYRSEHPREVAAIEFEHYVDD